MSILLTVLFVTAGLAQGVLIQPSNLNVVASEPANLLCSMTGRCTGFTWSGPAIEHGRERVVIKGPQNGAITISNVSVEDAGVYVCSCNDQDARATLTVVVPPSGVPDTPLILREGSTGIIPCPGDPGNQSPRIIWKFNDMGLRETHERLDNRTLLIPVVKMADAGTYTCRFDSSYPHTASNIIVTVEPQTRRIQFVPMPSEVELRYGDPLRLDCMVTNESAPANISWKVIVGSKYQSISSSTLNLGPDQVQSGIYSCNAYNAHENLRRSFDVNVTVNVWPVFPSSRETAPIVTAKEGETLSHEEVTKTTAPAIDRTTVTWRTENGEPVDFGSRLSVRWNGNTLTWSIDAATMADKGTFLMNFSNEFGSSEVLVILQVTEVLKETVHIQVENIPSCQFLKDHKDELVRTVAREYLLCSKECNRSLINTFLSSLDLSCDEDEETATFSLLIPEERIEAVEVNSISFAIAGQEFTGEILYIGSTPPTPSTMTGLPTSTVIPIAVTVSISTVVLAAIVITLAILKCKKSGHGVVNPEEPSIECPQVISSSYKEYQQNDVPVEVPSSPIGPANVPVTPVLVQDQQANPSAPPPSQPLYIPPSPVPGTRKSPPPQVTTVERPKNLYFRSHSYSHSVRTPPDQKSKP